MSLLRHALAASVGLAMGLAGGHWLRPGQTSPTVERIASAQSPATQHHVPAPASKHEVGSASRVEPVEQLADVQAEIEDLQRQRDALLGDPQPIYAPTQAVLEEWARCAQVPADVPTRLLTSADGDWFSPALVGDGLITEEEHLALEDAATTFEAESRTRLAEIYVTASGEDSTIERSLPELHASLRGLQRLLDPDGQQRRSVAEERAGLPHTLEADPDGPLVPYYRMLASVGDDFEETIADVVGPERARALRVKGNGWGARLGHSPRCTE